MAGEIFELTSVDRTGVVARGTVDYSKLLGLRGLVVKVDGFKTAPVPEEPYDECITHLVTSAQAIAESLKEKADQLEAEGQSADQTRFLASWWDGYSAGAKDGVSSQYTHLREEVIDFAMGLSERGERREAARWFGWVASTEIRTGAGVPAGQEIIIPIQSGRQLTH